MGDAVVGQLESLPNSAGYRLRVPSRFADGPVLVELEYNLAGRFAGTPWTPPRLLDGGVVEETRWEVRLPWSRAVMGVPSGWTDENQWLWDRYVWKRRPWKDAEALAAWVTGPAGRGGPNGASRKTREASITVISSDVRRAIGAAADNRFASRTGGPLFGNCPGGWGA